MKSLRGRSSPIFLLTLTLIFGTIQLSASSTLNDHLRQQKASSLHETKRKGLVTTSDEDQLHPPPPPPPPSSPLQDAGSGSESDVPRAKDPGSMDHHPLAASLFNEKDNWSKGTDTHADQNAKKKKKKNKNKNKKSKGEVSKSSNEDLPGLSDFLKAASPKQRSNTTQEKPSVIDYMYDDYDSDSFHDYYHGNVNMSDYEDELDGTQVWGFNDPLPDGFQTLQAQSHSGIFLGNHGALGFDNGYMNPPMTIKCPGKCECKKTKVVCAGQNYTSIPKGISPMTTDLDLSINKLRRLSNDSFAHLTHLQNLDCVGNGLSRLPKNLFKYNHLLQRLNFQGNVFKKVPPKTFQNLKYLMEIYLDANAIRSVPKNAFKGLNQLYHLNMDANRLDHLPSEALRDLTKLQALSFAVNNITRLSKYAFQNNTNLIHLEFANNHIEVIEDQAFYGLSKLRTLRLDHNRLRKMPTAFSHLTALEELSLEGNQLTHLPDMSFQFKEKLHTLVLRSNPIKSIGDHVFSHLPSLTSLHLSEVHDLTRFPDLTGTNSLETIQLDRANIASIPRNLCELVPGLTSFDPHSNKIGTIPDMSRCSMLLTLNLANNELTSLEGQLFKGLKNLRDLTLSINYIHTIPKDAFTDLTHLEYLNLAQNHISFIHPEAFLPLMSLIDLNLGENQLRHLPTAGLANLLKLKVFHNTELKEFPPKEDFPHVNNFVLSYAYHCCDFIHSKPEERAVPVQRQLQYEEYQTAGLLEDFVEVDPGVSVSNLMESHFNLSNEMIKSVENMTLDRDHDALVAKAHEYTMMSDEDYPNEFEGFDGFDYNDIMRKHIVSCRPKPGPFMPCDDLFGWWSLRCGVWFVFLLAILGNGVVFLVSVTSRSKMDVPRFLICNLAMADFIMGVYLAILAIVDAATLGQFKKSAIQWQTSPMCVTAGFLGVLSSELSVFTLTVITLERFYAITNAMQLNKRLSLKHACIIMACGWFWCFGLATLPLFGISDYRKFAVCLPFEIEDVISKSYVCFIMVFNGISFFIILTCYLVMYISIRNSQASNSNDTRVAKRMALLVFTDFLCWSPIAVLSLAAAFGKNLIHLNGAKVLTIFVLPLNSCANPFLYAIFTKQFKKDCVLLCRRLEDSSIARHFSQVSQRHVSMSWKCQRRPSALHSLMGEGKSNNNHSTGSNSYGVINYNSELSTGTNKEAGVKDAGFKDKRELPAKQQPTSRSVGVNQCKGSAGDACAGGSYSYKYSACPTKCDEEAAGNKMAESNSQRFPSGQPGGQIILHADPYSQTDTNACTSETYVNDDVNDDDHDVTDKAFPQRWRTGSGRDDSEDQDVWQKMGSPATGGESAPEGLQFATRAGRPHNLESQSSARDKEAGLYNTMTDLDNGGYYENGDIGRVQRPHDNGGDRFASSSSHTTDSAGQKHKSAGNPKPTKNRWKKNIKCCKPNSSPIETKEYNFTDQKAKDHGHKKRSKDLRKSPCVQYVMYMPPDKEKNGQAIRYDQNQRNDDECVANSTWPPTDDTPRETTRRPNEEGFVLKESLVNNASTSSRFIGDEESDQAKGASLVSKQKSSNSKGGKRHRLHRMHPEETVSNAYNNAGTDVPLKAPKGGKNDKSSPTISMLTEEILQHSTVDKSVHLRYFQQSMAGHNFVCKSNSLVELTESQLEEARSQQMPPGGKRRSLTPDQDGYLVFGGETDECLVESFHHRHHNHYSDYHPDALADVNDCADEECTDRHCHQRYVPSLVDLNAYPGAITPDSYDVVNLGLNLKHGSELYDANDIEVKDTFRTTSRDWEDADHGEIGVLLGTDSEAEDEENQFSLSSTKNSADKESGFHSQVSQV